MARRPVLTDDLIKVICDFVEEGNPYCNAFPLSGIPASTGEKWRWKAYKVSDANDEEGNEYVDEEDNVYLRCLRRMDEARARFFFRHIKLINKASEDPRNWTASLSMLERRDPHNFSRFSKPIIVAELKKTKKPTDMMTMILDKTATGKISPEDGLRLSNVIGNMVKIEENAELKQIIRDLDAKLSQYEKRK